MNNLFPPHLDIHTTFDLKGSLLGREFNEDELPQKPRATLKDMNWLHRQMHLELGPEKKAAFIEQVVKDVQLLKDLKIMDYSLLVGIHDLEKGNEERLREKNLKVFQPAGEERKEGEMQAPEAMKRTPSTLESARKAKELRQAVHSQRPVPLGSSSLSISDEMVPEPTNRNATRLFSMEEGGFRASHQDGTPGEAVYYLGIIDCLTKYNSVKKAEHFLKGLAAGHRKDDISAVPPKQYGDRFIDFMSGITMSREQAKPLPEPPITEKPLPDSPVVDRSRLSADNVDGANTLPIVDEAGEGSSIGDRSAHSSTSRSRGKRNESVLPSNSRLDSIRPVPSEPANGTSPALPEEDEIVATAVKSHEQSNPPALFAGEQGSPVIQQGGETSILSVLRGKGKNKSPEMVQV